MQGCIDLTSDGESPAGPTLAAAPRAPGPCITLLSSDEERSSQKPVVARNTAAAGRVPQASFGPGLGSVHDGPSGSLPQSSSLSPAQPKRARAKRTLKKVYGEEYDLSFGGSQSQADADPDFQSPKRARQAESGPGTALLTPDSVGVAIPEEDDDYDETPKPKKKGRGRITDEERAVREAEKERKKQERLQLREAKKREKEEEKAAKQAQKAQEKLKRQRETGKTALQDIALHLDPELAKHRTGREIMQKLEDTFGQPGEGGPCVELSQRLPMWPHRCATWSRSIHSTEPAERQDIRYMLVCLTAEEFVSLVAADRLESLLRHASSSCPQHTLGILIEGLEHHLSQRQRREFQANGPAGGGFNRAFVDEFLGGMACRWPGVRHVVVHDSAQAAEHVAGLTRALAEQPFRVEAAYVNSFGAGKPDTQAMLELLRKAPLPSKEREIWFRALCHIPALGPQIAHAVTGSHASMGSLVATYVRSTGSNREAMLQDMVRYGGQRVGPAGSWKIFQILTSDDPNLCIQETRQI